MTQVLTFDADARSRESVITINGRQFRPRKRTADIVRQLIEMEAEKPPTKDADGKALTPAGEALWNMTQINRQVALMIVDADTGKPPTPKFLEDSLGFDEGVDLVVTLLGADRLPAGNA